MKRILFFIGAVIASLSCERIDDGLGTESGNSQSSQSVVEHGCIVLGSQLEDPYKTENITKAIAALYPTKAASILPVETTDYYVRFLPSSQEEFDRLKQMGITLLDHPVDYEIVREGDWYHDPSLEEESITWQYAVVPKGFEFPEDIKHQVLHECYLPGNDSSTKASSLDWEAIEAKAYEITGNAAMLTGGLTKAAKVAPSGRITIVDSDLNGGKPFGVAGVQVSCNAFVKFATAYTDRDGYYTMGKSFSSKIRYRLVFKNEKNFSIGFNLILVPASVSTLGKAEPDGISLTVSKDSEEKLFRRCVVNNAVYDYITRCSEEDMAIGAPPADLRIWILNALESSSSPMIHQGAVVSHALISGFLGPYALLVKLFAPDITLGTSGREDYKSLYSTTLHELAHASHYAKVGNDYWNKYVEYILTSFASSGDCYGTGKDDNAGYCEVGEMWAYYLAPEMFKDRYGEYPPAKGESFWFYPEILRYIDARGVGREKIFEALGENVTSRAALKEALVSLCPAKRLVIEQAFDKYSE